MDDDDDNGMVDDKGIIPTPDGFRPIGERIISPTDNDDDDGSRVGIDWYNNDDELLLLLPIKDDGTLHKADAANVGFFIIPQSITKMKQ
jgi:hypothetical protein